MVGSEFSVLFEISKFENGKVFLIRILNVDNCIKGALVLGWITMGMGITTPIRVDNCVCMCDACLLYTSRCV